MIKLTGKLFNSDISLTYVLEYKNGIRTFSFGDIGKMTVGYSKESTIDGMLCSMQEFAKVYKYNTLEIGFFLKIKTRGQKRKLGKIVDFIDNKQLNLF